MTCKPNLPEVTPDSNTSFNELLDLLNARTLGLLYAMRNRETDRRELSELRCEVEKIQSAIDSFTQRRNGATTPCWTD